MKNFLAPIMKNQVIKTTSTEIKKFYTEHESGILTGGIIVSSMATTAVTYANADQIKQTIADAKYALSTCHTDEEKKNVYKLTLTTLVPLVTPIILLQGSTIGFALFSKKQSDKKIAAAASALSVAHEIIAQYQAFQKQAENALGEKEVEKIQKKICKDEVVDGRRFATLPSEGAPGEILMIDSFTGRPFWSTTQQVTWAVDKACESITPDDNGNVRNDMITIDDIHGLIGNKDLTDEQAQSELTPRFGYPAGEQFSARFTDTHYCFPNGTIIPAFKFWLYPAPGCVDWGC